MGDLILEDHRVIIMNCDEHLSKRFFDYMVARHFDVIVAAFAREYFLEFWEESKSGQDISRFIEPLQACLSDRVIDFFKEEKLSVYTMAQVSINRYMQSYDVAIRIRANTNENQSHQWLSETSWKKISINEIDVLKHRMKTGRKIESRTY